MNTQAFIAQVQTAFPKNQVSQSQVTEALANLWQDRDVNVRLIERLHNSAKVKQRYVALPIDELMRTPGFAERNDIYIKVALELAYEAVSAALHEGKIKASDIKAFFSTTVTGIAVPTIDARLMNRIAFSPQMKRLPFFGLGCVAGAASLSRAADYLLGHPDEAVMVLALELCSLTFIEDDISMANIVSSALFGDGAAAVLLLGREHAQANQASMPQIIDSRSYFFNNTERVMGFDVTRQGLKIVLSADVPTIACEKIPECVDQLLATHGLVRDDISAWVAHPGGPKVMDALETGLRLKAGSLNISHESLTEVGNLSSASVLMILQKTLAQKKFEPNSYGVLLAMGPAFCAEVVLLRF